MLAMPILLFSLLPIRKEEPGLGPSIAFATTTSFTSLLAILFIDLRIGVFANWILCEVWGQTIQSMAAKAMLSAHAVAPSIPQFNGLSKYRTNLGSPQSSAMPTVHIAVRTRGKGALGARCDYIGSPTNLIMITTTTLMLFAGRFGLAPSTNRKASAGLKLQDRESGLQTGDPAGFTATDTLACGSLGHIIGVGIVLGLKAVGSI